MNQEVTDIGDIQRALNQTAKQTVFARMVGLNQSNVSRHIKKGHLSENGTYGIWLKEYCRHLSETAAGRPENNDELRAVTIREKLAKARQSEVATAKELGQLVRVDEVGIKLQVAFEHMSGILKTASQSVVDEIKLEYGVDIDPAIINKHHTAALSEISKFSRPVESDNG